MVIISKYERGEISYLLLPLAFRSFLTVVVGMYYFNNNNNNINK